MMDAISTVVLDDLEAAVEAPCVSIYLPTHRAGRERDQDPIRFKNLLNDAADQLESQGLRGPDTATLLAPARALLDDSQFWSHLESGLAVIVHRGGLRAFRFPVDAAEQVTVARTANLEPLRRVLATDHGYWVLALSQHDVRLVRCTRYTAAEVDLDGVPHSMQDANWFVRRDARMRAQASGRVSGGRVAAASHGPAGDEHDVDEDLARFLRAVDAGVRSAVGDDTSPVVLAGVGSVVAELRRVSKLRHVALDILEGNPEHLSVDELQKRTLPLAEAVFGRV